MSNARSRDDLLRFIDYLSEKGLIPQGTAASRKATANQVTAILSEDEAADVTALDLEQVMSRFQNLNPHKYTPQSLQVYASRMKTTLDDFRSYCENPLGFKPSGQTRNRSRQPNEKVAPKRSASKGNTSTPTQTQAPTPPMASSNILPIPLRNNLVIQISGLPFDLSKSEAQKLANIILAHAQPDA